MEPIDAFPLLDLRVGIVTRAEPNEGARKSSFKLWLDFGPLGVKTSSAQLTELYTPESLVGRQVIGVVNFPPKQIGPFVSEALVTGFADESGAIVLAMPERAVPNGARLV